MAQVNIRPTPAEHSQSWFEIARHHQQLKRRWDWNYGDATGESAVLTMPTVELSTTNKGFHCP
jgi:hypothetical protein